MINISKKTLQDLEFESVILQVAHYNITSLGKTAILETIPFSKRADVIEALQLTNEFVASFENENRIPNHGFDAITKELKLIKIENNYFKVTNFYKVKEGCTVQSMLVQVCKDGLSSCLSTMKKETDYQASPSSIYKHNSSCIEEKRENYITNKFNSKGICQKRDSCNLINIVLKAKKCQ